MSQRAWWLILFWVVVIPAFIVGALWANSRLIDFAPPNTIFATYWAGTRAFLFENQSPYSDEITQEIQNLVSDGPVQNSGYTFRVTYPLYSTLFFAPFALINDYTLARAAWATAMELVILAMLYFCFRLTRWKTPLWLVAGLVLFALIWVHGFLTLLSGDSIAIVGLLLVLALLSIRSERFETAGILLAFTSIQILPVLLAVIFLIVWCLLSHRPGGVVLLLFFVGTLALLTTLGMFLQPGWPVDFMHTILRSPIYPPPHALGDVLAIWWPGIGRQLGWATTIILGCVMALEALLSLRRDFHWMLWTFCILLILSAWVGIPTSPIAFALFLLPLVLILSTWDERNRWAGRFLAVMVFLFLGIGLWFVFLMGRAIYPWPYMPPGLFIPAPLFLVFTLYWVRWWAIRPRRWFDEARAVER